MTSLRTVRLYGKLGARFGRIHRLAVASAAEAVRALCALRPGFERELMTSREKGVGYAVFLGKKNLRAEQLGEKTDGRDIRIAPVVTGAGFGKIFSVVLGVTLIAVASIITGGASVGAMMTFETGLMAGALSNVGFMLMMSGVTQMLSPQPKGLSTGNGVSNEPSYAFNGVVNTTAQGGPVPLGHGRMIVGSAVISAGIYSADRP